MTLAETSRRLNEAIRRLSEVETQRRSLHNSLQELKGNVRVMTRIRPSLAHDGTADADSCIDCSPADSRKLRLTSGDQKYNFSFDAVFGPSTKQSEIFEEVNQLIQSALDGYHVCLFSYGQTGSGIHLLFIINSHCFFFQIAFFALLLLGKTHTMQGSVSGEERGIIPRAIESVLSSANNMTANGGWEYSLECSFLEIYNETIRDLLAKSQSTEAYDIKRDSNGQTNIPGNSDSCFPPMFHFSYCIF